MPDLEDEICQTLTDLISNKFCQCGHLVETHFVGELTKIVKCFGLNNDGSTVSSCKCNKISLPEFKIEVKIEVTL